MCLGYTTYIYIYILGMGCSGLSISSTLDPAAAKTSEVDCWSTLWVSCSAFVVIPSTSALILALMCCQNRLGNLNYA